MTSQEQEEQDLPQEDERASESPAGGGEDEGSEGSEGPLGNPASDEETLSHEQQERDPSSEG
jgi:hypothetical protein